MIKIAVLLSCFNRKEKTQNCLSSLFKILPSCEVFLVDDNSTDGTAEMIAEYFPQVHVLKGDGNLFWSRGMYKAWKEATKFDFDFYLWLNDDVELYPSFWEELSGCFQITGKDSIISGLIENKFQAGQILYGGTDANKNLVEEHSSPQQITFMNGNVVLVPKHVVDKIGILDPIYHHDLGDVDYGLRAQKKGIKVYSTRKAVAAGFPNGMCRVRKWNSNLSGRFKKLYSPLGSPPPINFYFRKKHFGFVNASTYYAYLTILNILPDALVEAIWKDKYKDRF